MCGCGWIKYELYVCTYVYILHNIYMTHILYVYRYIKRKTNGEQKKNFNYIESLI